ncbi:hypothetical protein P3T76_001797 [Phytophthora citrophthora]|uniref:Uncharacterized protein n=1 Tax=Phytophthora citrophthora TaxID=4793 RepID=A0AAD9GW62_9STRA|nr:hypothetical protein P3T76_001797 [Phytophthora citrophthora]
MTWSQVAPSTLVVILNFGFTVARVTDRTLFLSTYSEDLNCTEIVYARIDNEVCAETSKCAIHNDSDNSFHDTEMTACILDRDEFLESAFRGTPYLTVELYPADCLGKSYNTRSFIADGKCHPYALSHFKVAQVNGTTAVWSSEIGCEDTHWYQEWFVLDRYLNSEACLTDGKKYWKSYFTGGTTTSWESSSDYEPTTPTPTTTTTSPPVTQAPPVSTLAPSLATPLSMVSTIAFLVCLTLVGSTFL